MKKILHINILNRMYISWMTTDIRDIVERHHITKKISKQRNVKSSITKKVFKTISLSIAI